MRCASSPHCTRASAPVPERTWSTKKISLPPRKWPSETRPLRLESGGNEMNRVRLMMVAMIVVGLPLSGCKKEQVAEVHHPAKVEDTDQKGIKKVTIEPRAAERIGLETTEVREEQVTLATGVATRKVVPYGALMYDSKG